MYEAVCGGDKLRGLIRDGRIVDEFADGPFAAVKPLGHPLHIFEAVVDPVERLLRACERAFDGGEAGIHLAGGAAHDAAQVVGDDGDVCHDVGGVAAGLLDHGAHARCGGVGVGDDAAHRGLVGGEQRAEHLDTLGRVVDDPLHLLGVLFVAKDLGHVRGHLLQIMGDALHVAGDHIHLVDDGVRRGLGDDHRDLVTVGEPFAAQAGREFEIEGADQRGASLGERDSVFEAERTLGILEGLAGIERYLGLHPHADHGLGPIEFYALHQPDLDAREHHAALGCQTRCIGDAGVEAIAVTFSKRVAVDPRQHQDGRDERADHDQPNLEGCDPAVQRRPPSRKGERLT